MFFTKPRIVRDTDGKVGTSIKEPVVTRTYVAAEEPSIVAPMVLSAR